MSDGGMLVPGVHRALAPAKVNLGLFVGPVRESDGRHELVSVMQSISLADELTLERAPAGGEHDEIVCPGVPVAGEQNLAAAALRAFRASTGWQAPPLRLSIVKRIPVAAGLGGGSADAAAALRLARHASRLGDEQLLRMLAAELGADVPAQVSPGRWLASGAGERLQQLAPARSPFGVLVLALEAALSTAAVYAEADRQAQLRQARLRTHTTLEERRLELSAALEHGAALPAATELLHNDLQRAAVSLCPQIADSLAQARDAGAELALLSGSGPTVLGLFPAVGRSPGSGLALAQTAAANLAGRTPAPICATPVDEAFARPVTLAADERRPGTSQSAQVQ
ncbi:MAG: 4-(cytidine 5-diphospho)-2-C-methyl-D-erythritol kinase [Solirubrobacterales bacterium]|nr:4-(cytidine 5-diphospho)-2-C-methyl-D-erythritol kinase [Solirubrobacterales bacterium]